MIDGVTTERLFEMVDDLVEYMHAPIPIDTTWEEKRRIVESYHAAVQHAVQDMADYLGPMISDDRLKELFINRLRMGGR